MFSATKLWSSGGRLWAESNSRAHSCELPSRQWCTWMISPVKTMCKILLFSFKKKNCKVSPHNFGRGWHSEKCFLSISVLQSIQINSLLIFKICTFHTRKDSQRREHFIPKWHSGFNYPLQQFCFERSLWLYRNQPDVNDESTMYDIPRRLKILLADRVSGNTTRTPSDLMYH